MRLQREGDSGARDADVAGREGEDPGEIECRNDQERCDERLVDSESRRDRGGRGDAKRHREPDPAGDLRSCARTTAEDAEDVERVGVLAAGARRACAPGDSRRHEHAEQQQRDRPAWQRAAEGAEREHECEPERPDGADRGRNPADRPEPPFIRQRTGKESEANCGSDPRRRERIHERAGAVPRRGVRAGRRPATTRQRRSPSGCGRHERAGERRSGEPDPDRRGVCEPFDPRLDAVAEQLRGRRQRDERRDRAQKEGEVALSQGKVEMHLVTVFGVHHQNL